MKLLAALLLVLSGSVFANEEGETFFMPENDFYIPVQTKLESGLTEAQFNKVIDRIEKIYSPIVNQMQGNLVIERKWEDGTVNASAIRMGKNWNVKMFGGLARHRTITEDGFSIVLCHEIGHHIGGAPKITSTFSMENWASNEGEADYWSTLKCLRNVLGNDDNVAIVKKMSVPSPLNSTCKKIYRDSKEAALCIRSGMAAVSVTNLFAELSGGAEAKFETPDSRAVTRTDDSHPAYQCRLDTFFQGAICDKDPREDVSQTDEFKATCHGFNGDAVGLRPRCWFKPSK